MEGYRALVAGSGPACLKTVSEDGPDLVMLDVVMPEMDGLAVLRQLKEVNPDLPVVMMSGNATIETAVQATKLGASDFVEKPLSTEKILITINNALKLARLRRENAELKRLAGDFEMIGESPAMKQIFEMECMPCGDYKDEKKDWRCICYQIRNSSEGKFLKKEDWEKIRKEKMNNAKESK